MLRKHYTLIETCVIGLMIGLVCCVILTAWGDFFSKASAVEMDKNGVISTGVVFYIQDTGGITSVYKFKYNGQTFLTSSKGGIIQVDK